jgi:DNA end-binding protein Ku
MARPTWSGAISFGLVNVPVQLFTAVRSQTIRFKQLNPETGAPVKQKRVDASTGEEVAYRDLVKGYEVAEDRYIVVEPEELEQLDPKATRLIDIRDFVEQSQIDPVYYDRAYYLAPDGETAAKPYRLLTEAMERSGKVAIATFVMRTKEHLGAIRARDGILVLSTMHHADEVAEPEDVIDTDIDAEVSERELGMAEQLIDSLLADFDPVCYPDEYRKRVEEFLAAKAEGEQISVAAPEEQTGKVVDLMSALEASLQRGQQERLADEEGEDGAGRADGASGAAPGDLPEDLEDLSRNELYELAQEHDIPGRSKLSKEELIRALRDGQRRAGAA